MKKMLLISVALMFIISSCVNKEAQEREKFIQDSIRAEQARLDSINNIGVWKIGDYIDEFGEKIGINYIYTLTRGRFSNSATTNSPLDVKITVDPHSVDLRLYEYSGNHPVKGEGYMSFSIKDSEGVVHYIETYNDENGNNYAKDLNYKSDSIIRAVLRKGGEIKFSGVGNKYSSPSKYWFTIGNADYLEKALSRIGQTLERID